MAEDHGSGLEQMLVERGYITATQLAQLLELVVGVPYVHLSNYVLDPEAVALLPQEIADRTASIPLWISDDTLIVAMTEPDNTEFIDDMRLITGMSIQPVLAEEDEILAAIARTFAGTTTDEAMIGLVEAQALAEDADEADEAALARISSEPPIIQLVNLLLFRAAKEGASDIHIQLEKDNVLVRFRIDGVLYDSSTFPTAAHAAIVSRIKVMCDMDIAERRLPQDGRTRVPVAGREIDLRVSTIPGMRGEKCVIRLLDSSQSKISLDEVGLLPAQRQTLDAMLARPYGLIVVTGPTGAGKTSTIYAALNKLSTEHVAIISVEDPIEYELPLVTQVNTLPKAGVTFASVLRAALRQDPDVLMVGEIRDRETADVAVHASLTGHIVLSSLHTNDAVGALIRMCDLGVPPFLLGSALVGATAQRLVRILCECAETSAVTPAEATELQAPADTLIKRPIGCDLCRLSGYRGRAGVHEVFEMTAEVQRALGDGAGAAELRHLAESQGMMTLHDATREKVLAHETSLHEWHRVSVA